MESGPRKTDERLCSWLDANQLDRERLCLAVISVDRRFINPRPRHPRGGRDGGRDIEAELTDGRHVWFAVGFLNSANDSTGQRTTVQKKFKSDLDAAQRENSSLPGFVFFTNVNLTATEKGRLLQHSKSKGIEFCDIFDRERIRILLDSPDGLSTRYQYLQIPLSETEQAAFFARWGSELQDMMSESFEGIERRLQRVEFNQERERPLRHLAFLFEFDRAISVTEMPHFRAQLVMAPSGNRGRHTALGLGIADGDGSKFSGNQIGTTIAGGFWSGYKPKVISTFGTIRPPSQDKLYASSGFSDHGTYSKQVTLGELDENYFLFFATKIIAERITRIEIHANNYVLWEGSRDKLRFDSPNGRVEWPWPLSPQQRSHKWIRVMHGGGPLRFNDFTPKSIWRAYLNTS